MPSAVAAAIAVIEAIEIGTVVAFAMKTLVAVTLSRIGDRKPEDA